MLVLFSGPYARPDGLGAYLTALGLTPVMVDNDSTRGGDDSHDLRHDTFFQSLIRRCAAGEFLAIIAAPPCSTFSISRFIKSARAPGRGAPVVRTRAHITGIPDIDPSHVRELNEANELVRRMCEQPSAGVRVFQRLCH